MIFVDQEGKIKNVIDEVKDKATIDEVLKRIIETLKRMMGTAHHPFVI